MYKEKYEAINYVNKKQNDKIREEEGNVRRKIENRTFEWRFKFRFECKLPPPAYLTLIGEI